jgi:2-oxoglutarate ferredoxin oxidoreductase subunit alpha
MGLAVSLELPLVIVDIQRGGPSTGLPTKTEQADLLQAMYGRHGESPLPIVAAQSPAHCFEAAIEAARIAVTYRTPVLLLSDGYIANSSEPWLLPDVSTLQPIDPRFATKPNHTAPDGAEVFWPYARDPETLGRDWALPGTPGLMHRIGGIEKEDGSGNISYDPANHEAMVRIRAAKVAAVAKSIAPVELEGDADADLCVLGWGSTWGAIGAAVLATQAEGKKVARVHLMHLNPFPPNLGEVLERFKRIIVPEMNTGQLTKLVRAEFLVPAEVLSKVQGQPFTAAEIKTCIDEVLEEMGS